MVYQNSETYRRPGLLERRENVEVNLITSRKELSASRKNKSLQATARCEILFGLIREKKWEEVLQKLDYYESDAKQWIEEHNDDGTTRWKSLLIHLVCERKPPTEIVIQLIRIYPESVGIKNYGGDLPIHVACREGASAEVIDLILNSDEYECARIADCEGRLPLHLAASNNNVSVKTIQNLIKVNERATRTPDDFNLLPLHWACSKNASPRVVETIIQAYPYAVESEDAWGRTPKSLAKSSKNSEKAQILELLSRDVSSWTTAMVSTVVTLSNKVLEAEKMEADYKEQVKKIGALKEGNEFKDRHIDTLKLEMKLLEERFVDEIQYLKKAHARELEAQKKDSDDAIAELTKEKEEAERKLEELKKLVDDVVAQLKQQHALVEEKEAERKNLKERAVALIQKINDQKEKRSTAEEENKELKIERNDLKIAVEERDERLRKLKHSFQQPMRMLDEVRSTVQSFDESPSDEGRYVHRSPTRGGDRREHDKDARSSYSVLEQPSVAKSSLKCTRLDDGSFYA